MRQSILLFSIAIFLSLPFAQLVSQENIEFDTLLRTCRETIERVDKEPVTWIAKIELPSAAIALVRRSQTLTMHKLDFSFEKDGLSVPLAEIIVRDEYWYVKTDEGRFKYRPFEAPLKLPSIYSILEGLTFCGYRKM